VFEGLKILIWPVVLRRQLRVWLIL